MAQVVSNQYYDPSAKAAEVSQGLGGLAQALFGDPAKASDLAYKNSESKLNDLKAQRQQMANTAVSQGLADALNSGDINKIISQGAAGEINPEFAKMSGPISSRDAGYDMSKALAVEGIKPHSSDEEMARVFKSLPVADQIKIAKQHLAPDRSGSSYVDQDTGEIVPATETPDLPEQQGPVQYAPDKSTMGSMINSLGAPPDASVPRAAAIPPPALNNNLSPDLPPAAQADITRASSPVGQPQQQPQQSQQPAPQRTFGFDVPHEIPGPVYKGMVENDKKQLMAAQSNVPVAHNVLQILDQIEPNLNNFKTGFLGDTRLMGDKALSMIGDGSMGGKEATAGANIDKGTNELATELGKFQYIPGMRSSVMGLQTILASKPGVTQPAQTNQNIIASIRAKVTDYQLSTEIAQRYRDANPRKITDSNTATLDNALKTIYPIESVDQSTGNTTFNKQNALKIRQMIPDAIANPKKYIDRANAIMSGQDNPDTGTPASPPGAKSGGVLHIDAKGNKAMVYPDGSFEEVH